MRHECDRAGELREIAFQHFERGDIQIVGRLIEEQHVGGPQHEPRDVNARAFAAGKPAYGKIELFLPEQKARRPARHMLRPVAEHYCIAFRRQRATQRSVGVNLVAGLFELGYPQTFGTAHFACIGLEFARENAQQRGLAAAVRTENTHSRARARV